MRAVQQSMTMAMAVNMASSPPSFMSPVGSGSGMQSHNPQHQQPPSLLPITHQTVPKDGVTQTQPVPENHSSRYPPCQQLSNSSIGNNANNSRQRKRRANSNATER